VINFSNASISAFRKGCRIPLPLHGDLNESRHIRKHLAVEFLTGRRSCPVKLLHFRHFRVSPRITILAVTALHRANNLPTSVKSLRFRECEFVQSLSDAIAALPTANLLNSFQANCALR
jgi:hypothetical protein